MLRRTGFSIQRMSNYNDPMQNTLPDYHFLLIASNLGAEWFFEGARDYWERFRPTVISDLSILSILPEDVTVAVTAVARRDRIAELGVELSRLRPDALFDPVVFDFYEDTKQTLDNRAQTNQPFGVPLLPTETPTPGPTAPPVYPTPGSLPGQEQPPPGSVPPGTPSPTVTDFPGMPTVPALPTRDPDAEPPTPLFPTPGPITGG